MPLTPLPFARPNQVSILGTDPFSDPLLSLRLILIQDTDGLLVYDIMDHDQVRAWLRRR